jgi:hypothetical protein
MDSNQFDHQIESTKKVEFDMNTIDSALWKVNFRGMEFIFDKIDTWVTGKHILPIFINETLSDYGNNKLKKVKRTQSKIKNSGFSKTSKFFPC